jgi:hypothetical protein
VGRIARNRKDMSEDKGKKGRKGGRRVRKRVIEFWTGG